MGNIDLPKELGQSAIAAIAAFFVGLLLKALGAGKWLVAGGGGAAGGIIASAVVA
jgi:hypothetical protein